MTYAVNDAKRDPDTGLIAVKTGMTDPDQSWLVVMTSDGTCHYVPDADIEAWDDLTTSGGN